MSFRMSEIPKPAGDLELDFLRVVRQGEGPTTHRKSDRRTRATKRAR